MSPRPYPRPAPKSRPTQPELDGRCLPCRAGSHRACVQKTCTCRENDHGASR